MAAMIKIKDDVFISEKDVVFKFSRSSGPGGQNVNKISSRVTLLFNPAGAEGLNDSQKRRILRRLSKRVDKNGCVRVVSQKYRTQKANRRAASERLSELLAEALKKRPIRKKTKVPGYARRKRLEDKKRRSMLKRQRAERLESGE